MQLFVKSPETEFDQKSNLLSWVFKSILADLPEFKDLKDAIKTVEQSYNCTFTVYVLDTHYYIISKLPDESEYKYCYPKAWESADLISALKKDILSEWEDKLYKF